MENKIKDLKAAAADAGKNAINLFDKAKKKVVAAVDQNDDGKFDISDISSIADQIGTRIEQQKLENERKTLQPVFAEDLDNPEFMLSKMIRVVEMDQKHKSSVVCEGSIGHISVLKDMKILNIYPKQASVFGINLEPNDDSELYYVDPSDRDSYIALDDYFNYLKIARVAELQRIAQDLGAKYFKVRFCEYNKTFIANKADAKAEIKVTPAQKGSGEFHHDASKKKYSEIEISAEMKYIGHTPVIPVLKYYKNDPQIKNLVEARMAGNQLTNQKYTLGLSLTSGIKVKDAVKIDAVLSAMKYSGNATVTSEAQTEARRFFEYEIDF